MHTRAACRLQNKEMEKAEAPEPSPSVESGATPSSGAPNPNLEAPTIQQRRTFGNTPLSEQGGARRTVATITEEDGATTNEATTNERGSVARSIARAVPVGTPVGPSQLPVHGGVQQGRLPPVSVLHSYNKGMVPGGTAINVPFRLNHIAKSHGAKWDPVKRTWWLEPGVSASGLQELLYAGGNCGATARQRRSAIGSASSEPTPLPAIRARPTVTPSVRTPEPIRLDISSPDPIDQVNRTVTTAAQSPTAGANAPTAMSPILMNNLNEDSPKNCAHAGVATALGAVTVGLLIFVGIMAMGKLPVDCSAAISVAAICVPLRWERTMATYNTVGERVGEATAHLIPTITRYSGSIVVVLIVILLTRRVMGMNIPTTHHTGTPVNAVGGYVASQPRMDLLTHAEAKQLHLELLAGYEAPDGMPSSITDALCIVDTGCGRSMANHVDQFAPGSMREHESAIAGAAGTFTTKQCGTMRMPIITIGHGREQTLV